MGAGLAFYFSSRSPDPRFQLFLLSDIAPYFRLIKTDRANAVPFRPEVQSRQTSPLQYLALNPHRTFAFQKTNRVRDAELRRNAQTHMNMVRHAVPFQNFDATLPTQLTQQRTDALTQSTENRPTSKFRDDHNVILALPPYMGQVLPFVYGFSLQNLAPRAFPTGEPTPSQNPPDRSNLFRSTARGGGFRMCY